MVPVGEALLGRILDGLGQPMDHKGYVPVTKYRSVQGSIPQPLERQRIKDHLSVGVRAIDGVLTCGRGQRIGVFAGSGVGKSTLLGMMARHTEADVNVIALIGERGREVREFIERDLGPDGLARSVVVVATSDQPALVRIKGAMVATTIAEYFRDLGRDVLFVMDSVTRLALAQREVGLAIGEPPATRGYTPSVFALMPKLLERTGPGPTGTITAFYTVLVEGDDMNEPIADTVRGILDGHIVLNRALAERNHYPAIDVLASISRLMVEVTSQEHQELAAKLRAALAAYAEAEDLINIGAYAHGSNPEIDEAIRLYPGITAFLRQGIDERSGFSDTLDLLKTVFS
jgi:FliI/YscN family ATPase